MRHRALVCREENAPALYSCRFLADLAAVAQVYFPAVLLFYRAMENNLTEVRVRHRQRIRERINMNIQGCYNGGQAL